MVQLFDQPRNSAKKNKSQGGFGGSDSAQQIMQLAQLIGNLF